MLPTEEEEEEEEEPPRVIGTAPEPPPVHWDDDIRMYESDDCDDVVQLADLVLVDYDDEQVVTDEETNCPGKKFPEEKAALVGNIWLRDLLKRNAEYEELCDEVLAQGDENAPLPPFPLKVFPEATGVCVMRGYCHHREYKTHDTSTTRSTLGYRKPELMLQVFSLRLSSSEPYPVSVYGIFAVRDDLEPLRNHVFNRSCRDDAVTVDQDSFTLPLCSPCRGMYVLDNALLEVDLWVKKEGDGSADKKLLSAYAEIGTRSRFDKMRVGRITNDLCSLDVAYMLFTESVETVIQVFANVDRPHHVRFTAFSSGFDHEIVLFDDKFSGNKKLFQHVVAVKAEEKLDVCLKLEESLFWWTFHDGTVGAVRAPHDSELKYGQFDVRVLFAPKNSPCSTYPDWMGLDGNK